MRWPHDVQRRVDERRLFALLGKPTQVLGGPFRNMKYLSAAFGSMLLPKLLGTYEKELHNELDRLAHEQFDTILDVGAAEGYYAVGCALLFRKARVIGFEINPYARTLLRALAARNAVLDRVVVREECTREELSSTLSTSGRTLLICDCDGPEDDLLVPDSIPRLQQATIIVETHDRIRPGVTERLVSRFSVSHRIVRVNCEPRTIADAPCALPLATEDLLKALDEWRMEQEWLVMRPRQTAGPAASD
jgi:hypothetical protein